MASTAERGYGYRHQRLRAILLRALIPGTPCSLCGQPMWPSQAFDLGHVEGSGKTLYEGLQHRSCNTSSGAKYGHQLAGHDGSSTRRRRRRWPPRPITSREW